MNPGRIIGSMAMLLLASGAAGQCTWYNDTTESLGTIRSAVIKREAMSFIDWIWEYDGTGKKPGMLHLKGVSDCDTHAQFSGHGVQVRIDAVLFDSTKHTFAYDGSATGRPILCEIDGRSFRGTHGRMPTRAIGNLAITIDSARVSIPREAWDDLYHPNFCTHPSSGGTEWECHVARSLDRKRVYIHMSNSDGGGSYEVVWIFINGRYVRRVIEGPP